VAHSVLVAPVRAGAGIEASARALRYAALDEERRRVRADAILTGHTASDQAETVLMRLARGASLRGAAGIVEHRRDAIVRPLLFATRDEVLAYVAALRLPVIDDEMNRDERLLRTRVRERALPALEAAAGPGVARALARFATLAAEDEAYLAALAAEAGRPLVADDGSLDAGGLTRLAVPLARRVLAAWLEGQGVPLDAALVGEALTGLTTGRTTTLPGDRLLTCEDGRGRLAAAPPRRLHGTSSGTRGRSRG
jgi:tRNA(Ile)-lysidine synthase